MIQTKIFRDVKSDNLSNKVNEFIKEHSESNPTFKVLDIKYQAFFGINCNNHCALIIYEDETKEEKDTRYRIGMDVAKIHAMVCCSCNKRSDEYPDLKFIIAPYKEGRPAGYICEDCWNKENTDN